VVSFEAHGGEAEALSVIDSMKVCKIAASYGSMRSLIEHPALMSYMANLLTAFQSESQLSRCTHYKSRISSRQASLLHLSRGRRQLHCT